MKLKPFQETGRDFLAVRHRALLADEMRLGKTAQAVTAAAKVGARSVLVICPAIARPMWRREFWQWWDAPGCLKPILVVASYDEVRTHLHRFTLRQWDVLILDEGHYLKNPEAGRCKAVYGRGGVGWYAKRIWALSGTPAPNHAGELWPMLRAFGATRMGYQDYARYYCQLDHNERIRGTKKYRIAELRATLEPIMMRRLKKDVAPELPACSVTPYYVEFDPSWIEVTRPVNPHLHEDEMRRQAEALKEALTLLPTQEERLAYLETHTKEFATLRRLLAVCKAPAVYRTLMFELEAGLLDKVVVFGYHVEALVALQRTLKGNGVEADILYGGTPEGKRESMLRRFQRPVARKGSQVLVAQLVAAGTAIDLSAAHQGVLLERDWVPGNNAQALERMGGYKQTQPVTVRDVVIEGSIDEILHDVVGRKTEQLAALLD